MTSSRIKYVLPALTALALTVTALPARAQDWPQQAIHIIVPFGPGGGSDLLTRILAEAMELQRPDSHCRALGVEFRSCSERNRARAKNRRRVVKEYLVDGVGSERNTVHRRPAFDHHRRDFQFSQAAKNRRKVRASMRPTGSDFLHANPEFFQLSLLPRTG